MEKSVVIAYDRYHSFYARNYKIIAYLQERGFLVVERGLPYEFPSIKVDYLLMIRYRNCSVETTIRNIGAKANLLLTGEITVPEFNRLRRAGLNGLMGLSVTPEQVFGALSFLPEHSVLNTSLIVPTAIFSNLSDREKQVLELIAEGLTIKEIGNRFSISPNTVKIHLSAIRVKLGLPNKAQLIRFYLDNCVPDR